MEARTHTEFRNVFDLLKSDNTAGTTKIAYEDIRLSPQTELTRHLINGTVEKYLSERKIKSPLF